MPRYIDADNLVSVLDILCDKGGDIRYWEQLKWIVADCPTADVAEVVRCKDCKWQRKRLMDNGYYWYGCRNGNGALGLDGEFCSDGERRTDDE